MLMDQGSIAVGPLFIDKNFLGQHLDFRVRLDKILTRQSLDVVTRDGDCTIPTDAIQAASRTTATFRSEGSAATVTLTKTLWSLASKWGGGGAFDYRNAIARSYFGAGLRALRRPRHAARSTTCRASTGCASGRSSASATRQWGSAEAAGRARLHGLEHRAVAVAELPD